MTGMPASTLYRWKKNRSDLYAIVERGCLEIKLDGYR